MQSVLTWIGLALLALLAVAVLVTAWEHVAQAAKRRRALQAPVSPEQAPPKVNVDLHVDEFTAAPAASGDSTDRRAALEQTMGKLTQVPAEPSSPATPPAATHGPQELPAPLAPARPRPASWVDTEPMIGPGLRAEMPRLPAKAGSR